MTTQEIINNAIMEIEAWIGADESGKYNRREIAINIYEIAMKAQYAIQEVKK